MREFLIAVALLFSVGGVSSVVLTLAFRLFGKESGTAEARLREILPGANCGACGYTGCDGYADALARGVAETHLCIPGADAVAERIAEILGKNAARVKRAVPYVHCRGTYGVLLRPAVYDGFLSCAVMELASGGYTACVYSCLGGGDCAHICPADAIRIVDGIAKISYERCIGCGACAKICPKGIIEMIPKESRAVVGCSSRDAGAVARHNCKNACIACGKCERSCPCGAVSVSDNLARIDYGICTRCGICIDVCPTGCIDDLKQIINGERI